MRKEKNVNMKIEKDMEKHTRIYKNTKTARYTRDTHIETDRQRHEQGWQEEHNKLTRKVKRRKTEEEREARE